MIRNRFEWHLSWRSIQRTGRNSSDRIRCRVDISPLKSSEISRNAFHLEIATVVICFALKTAAIIFRYCKLWYLKKVRGRLWNINPRQAAAIVTTSLHLKVSLKVWYKGACWQSFQSSWGSEIAFLSLPRWVIGKNQFKKIDRPALSKPGVGGAGLQGGAGCPLSRYLYSHPATKNKNKK